MSIHYTPAFPFLGIFIHEKLLYLTWRRAQECLYQQASFKRKQLKSLGCVHTKIYYSEVKINTTIKKTKLDKFCLHNTEGNMQSTVPYFYKY